MAQSNVITEEIRPRTMYSIDQILGVSSTSTSPSKTIEGMIGLASREQCS